MNELTNFEKIVCSSLAETMSTHYGWLLSHEHELHPNIYAALVSYGQHLIDEYPNLVAAIADARGDFITSDREVAALGMTLCGPDA